ncbi:hypothetical protein, partial [Staphylococcus aureus]|uniref:hypothetical protein n=1 Tax=Staphylococcus aureus TaxID=1280 RepID=UPI001E380F28
MSQKRDTTAFYDITLKLLKTLRMSGFARYPMYTWGQISLMLLRSYGVLREKIKILDFDKKCLAG